MTLESPESGTAGHFLFEEELTFADPDLDHLIEIEDERQIRKIILIASESVCPRAVREALGTSFSNLYAEGYPSTRMAQSIERPLLSFDHHLSFFRRYYDRRYYKGCDYINFVEALCKQRAAALFATDRFDGPGPKVPASDIFVNTQPLSGAAANNAVYNAFVNPGDTVMGLHLSYGGHLTHGSPVNRSGMSFNIVPYTVNRATGQLDYDQIKDLAREHKPRMIIGGFSAYPWSIDWQALREAADAVGNGCILLADVSHPAGLIVAGQFPSPIGIADVTMTTTHKTLCGPRGALLVTTDPEKAKAVELGVFPGEQGGPHIQSILAKAVAFRIALTKEFQTLQRKIKENAAYLAGAIRDRGLKLAYNGTDSHLFLIDLNPLKGVANYPLRGEVASRILDLCDITLNKNTIAGDTNAAHPSGIRIGTTWITQRGFEKQHLDHLADLIHKVLTSTTSFRYIGPGGDLGRGRIGHRVMEEVKEGVRSLLKSTNPGYPKRHALYPFFSLWSGGCESAVTPELEKAGAKVGMVEKNVHVVESFGDAAAEAETIRSGCGLVDLTQAPLVKVTGERAAAFLQSVVTSDVINQEPGTVKRTFMLGPSGELKSSLLLFRLERDETGFDSFILSFDTLDTHNVFPWLRGLSDGYVLFDENDIFKKVEGPVVISNLRRSGITDEQRVRFGLLGPGAGDLIHSILPETEKLEQGTYMEVDCGGTTLMVAHDSQIFGAEGYEVHMHPLQSPGMWRQIVAEGRKMVRPVGYTAIQAATDGRCYALGSGDPPSALTLLEAHPEAFDLGKPFFVGRSALPALKPKNLYVYEPEKGPLKKTPLNEIHRKLTKKDFMIPFAGWEMPVWYTRVSDEHNAVRQSAGLFDVGHMGVFGISGPLATRFLDFCTTGYVTRMAIGQAQYSYLLDPDGKVLDDIMIYRRERENYQVVCNAVNAEKNLAWLTAVNSGDIQICRNNPGACMEGSVSIRDLKDPGSGDDRRVDLALQGPASRRILLKLVDSDKVREQLLKQQKSTFIEIDIAGVNVITSRTGYTGEEIAYELYVHPDNASVLWNAILEAGEPLGVVPTGLGARDSLRTEAGLPLYGHELAGDYDIDPIEAGYGSFVKFHKPFFIGREPLLERWQKPHRKQIVRFRITTKMPRTIRPGDPVVERSGRYIGNVTSCTLVKGKQIGMAFVDPTYSKVNSRIAVFPVPTGGKIPPAVAVDQVSRGDRLVVSERAKVISRFPMRS